MTSDPAPSYPSDPPTQATPAYDPVGAVTGRTAGPDGVPCIPAPARQRPVPGSPRPGGPGRAPRPAVAGPHPAPPAHPGPAVLGAARPVLRTTRPVLGAARQYSAPPAQYSGPPAQFPAPAAPVTGSFGPVTGASGAYGAPPGADPYLASPAGQPGPYPPLFAPPVPGIGQQPTAVQIGEILVSPPVIRTPAGVMPLAGANWYVTDYWQREEKIASWAIVCAILGFFCLTIFSLLFLLIKETRHYGTVQVTVTSGGHQYVARIPVVDQGQVQQINNQVNYARSLSTV